MLLLDSDGFLSTQGFVLGKVEGVKKLASDDDSRLDKKPSDMLF